MNLVVLVGRISHDPEIRYANTTNGQMAIANFSIAVPKRVKKDEARSASFIRCVAFGGQADFIEKYMFKGTSVAVSGRLDVDTYTDKDGNRRESTRVMVDNIEFAGSSSSGSNQNTSQNPQNGSNNAYQGRGNNQYSKSSVQPQNRTADPYSDFMNIPDGVDDVGLPFN